MQTSGIVRSNPSSNFESLAQFDDETAKLLGEGSFGLVQAMKNLDDGTTYALKSFNIDFIFNEASDKDDAQRLYEAIFKQAQMMRTLKHPNVVTVFGSFNSGTFYIVMEFCSGGSLRQLIDSAHVDYFREEKILEWFGQLLKGLRYMHSRQIFHRDIKAENILMDSSHQMVKLGDFGISKTLPNTMISARRVIGTISHMPPEILKGQAYVRQSDVWSLGVVLFDICARKLPFASIQVTIDDSAVPDIHDYYSVDLRRVLTQMMLVKDAAKRATVEELCRSTLFFDYAIETDQGAIESISKEETERLRDKLSMANFDLGLERSLMANLQAQNANLVAQLKKMSRELRVAKVHIASLNSRIAELENVDTNEERAFSESDAILIEAAKRGDLHEVMTLLSSGARATSQDDHGNTALMAAAEKGHLEVVSQLLANGAEVNSLSQYGQTALMYAAMNGHLEVLSLLLANGADVNMKSYEKVDSGYLSGWTALIWASYRGHLQVVSQLLAHGAKLDDNRIYYAETTALIKAAEHVHQDIVSLLLNNGAKVDATDRYGSTALMYAAGRGSLEIVSQLLTDGAHVNRKSYSGSTPLIGAACSGHLKVVSHLLANGARVNSKNKEGETALIKAASKEVVSLLLSNGADVNIRCNDGTTALMIAAAFGNLDKVSQLLAKGANVNIINDKSNTALTLAVCNGHLHIASLLLDNGADDVNCKTDFGWTALMWAADRGYLEVVGQLLAKGADVNIKGDYGYTALMRAAENGHLEVAAQLLDNGADVNSTGDFKETALILAAEEGYLEVVSLLLARGADVNIKTDYKKTALMEAAKNGHLEVVSLLLANGADGSGKTNEYSEELSKDDGISASSFLSISNDQ